MAVRKTTKKEPIEQSGEEQVVAAEETEEVVSTTNETPSNYNYFTELNSINVGDKAEKKNGLTYLSWAWAWSEIKKKHPKAFYTIYENENSYNYFTDGNTCWVKTGVTIPLDDGDIEHIEYLPVMDFRNASIRLDKVTSFDVNKAIQRSLTKACARHGLGLYIYAGEDLPEDEKNTTPEQAKATVKAAEKKAVAKPKEAALTKEQKELQYLRESIQASMNELTSESTKEEKVAFANNIIKPTIGMVNYNLCGDIEKLKALKDKLDELKKVS